MHKIKDNFQFKEKCALIQRKQYQISAFVSKASEPCQNIDISNVSSVVNICKDHRDKIEVPDPLAVEDLISCKLNNKPKLTLKTRVILCNTLKKEGRAFRNIGKNISLYCVISFANFRLYIESAYFIVLLICLSQFPLTLNILISLLFPQINCKNVLFAWT